MPGSKCAVLCAVMAVAWGVAQASDTFTTPTKEELSMTSLAGYPGVSALVLNYDEVAKDDLHVIQHYERIKVLTEDGKKYANVELSYVRTGASGLFDATEGNDQNVGDIDGRTIHPDGTIIPFTGKPYLKELEKSQGVKVLARVFTLPDVEVGSIIEYRYASRYNDRIAESPDWIIQRELFVKSAHYAWYPTLQELIDSKQRHIDSITWFPILPAGVSIDRKEVPAADAFRHVQQVYELTVHDIPPTVKDEYQPPLSSYSYRVYFNFTAFHTSDDYWKSEGKDWSRQRDSFMKESSDVRAAADAATAGETTAEGKLRKLYAKVESMENTQYTRERDKTEQGRVSNVSDVLQRGRGTATQLTEVFVAMARAEGFKSYLMLVPNRAEHFFIPQWLNFGQFDDVIAIVNFDGKDTYLDPGWRYTPYGKLAWQHTFVQGLRQVEGGTAFALTSGDGYAGNVTDRVANLNLDDHGQITGKIDLHFSGAAAINWRHLALRGDAESLNEALRRYLQMMVPETLEVKVASIENLYAYEQPLKVAYDVRGTLGAPTGKRLVLPADLFEARSSAKFDQEKRETPVDFNYAQATQDALRINFTKGFELEGVPKADSYALPKRAIYNMKVTPGSSYFETRRNFVMGDFLFTSKDYPDLRTFYAQRETKDKDSVVLKMVPIAPASGN